MLDFIGLKGLLVILIFAVVALGLIAIALLNVIVANLQQQTTNTFVVSEQLRTLSDRLEG